MANEYIWVDANEREVQVSGPATAAFEAGYTDRQISAHTGADPLDHPDGSVTLDKLDDGVKDYFARKSDTDAHIVGRANPHGVTKAQVGLGNADNTADMDKPISTAMRAALDTKQEKETGKGLSAENYTAVEKEKLAGVETGANAYTHPQTHAAAMIEQDDSRQFVTAAEKEGWNAKAAPSDIQAGENVHVSVSNGKVTISATGGGEGGGVTVADDLTSTSPVSALSANQGRVLDEKITEARTEAQETAAEKAPLSHASADGMYGLGSQTQYGHVKLRGDLNAQATGEAALDAAMGYALKQAVDAKPNLDDIVAGENIALEKADGKVTIHVSDLMDNMSIVMGSYIGTGTYGADNPISIHTDYPPAAMWIRAVSANDYNTTEDGRYYSEKVPGYWTNGCLATCGIWLFKNMFPTYDVTLQTQESSNSNSMVNLNMNWHDTGIEFYTSQYYSESYKTGLTMFNKSDYLYQYVIFASKGAQSV